MAVNDRPRSTQLSSTQAAEKMPWLIIGLGSLLSFIGAIGNYVYVSL